MEGVDWLSGGIWFGVVFGGALVFAAGYALGRFERWEERRGVHRVIGSRETWRRLEQEESARRWAPGNE